MSDVNLEMRLALLWRKRPKCAGTNIDGSPCRMFARADSKYCHAHRGGTRNNVCLSCGKRGSHGSECGPCRNLRLKREGRCNDCRRPIESGTRCDPCRERNYGKVKRRRAQLKKEGKCIICRKPAGKKAHCEECLAKKRKVAA